jgi:hypothetical protein
VRFVEKKMYELGIKVLNRLERSGVLGRLVLVGSWCMLFYEEYFKGKGILPLIRTRDMEFLIPLPFRTNQKIDVSELLQDLGFVTDYKGDEGYTLLQHPDLILEFIVPARGDDSYIPGSIRQLGIKAQALRFMDFLAEQPIRVPFAGISVTIPHPAKFALQKLLIAGRRKEEDKAIKDRAQAVALLKALKAVGEYGDARRSYHGMPKTWQKVVKRELSALGEQALLDLLTEN